MVLFALKEDEPAIDSNIQRISSACIRYLFGSLFGHHLYQRALFCVENWWPSADKSNAHQLTKVPLLDPTIRLSFPRSET